MEVLITTGNHVEGYEIVEYHGIVRGGHFLARALRIDDEEQDIQTAKTLEVISRKAEKKGANAIVGLNQQISVDYGCNKHVEYLGTMVTIKKKE